MSTTSTPRLFIVQAPEAGVAVIIRRGPSRFFQLIRWDMRTDEFERGQWFKGRIYARRCDLSPDGELLVYFAAKFKIRGSYPYSWTAVSRAPWFTALALWPKGDCWAGGGLFTGNRSLMLNHHPEQAIPHPNHIPRGLTVTANPGARGEDDPLYSQRLERDGWVCTKSWEVDFEASGFHYTTRVPERRVKRHVTLPLAVIMERRLDGLTYRESFEVEGLDSLVVPEKTEWLDWDSRGRLFALCAGQVQVADVAGGTPDFGFSRTSRPTVSRPGKRPPPPKLFDCRFRGCWFVVMSEA